MIEQWTEERVEKLKALWASGASATEIACELGDVARNAILGKVHRLGLSNRTKKQVIAKRKPPRKKPAAGVHLRAKPIALDLPVDDILDVEEPDTDNAQIDIAPADRPCALFELEASDCHWPIGDPLAADFHFCGGVAVVGRPYCRAHTAIAYQPLTHRRISPVLSDAERVRRANHARTVSLSRTKGGGFR